MCWVPQCSTALVPSVSHTFTVTLLYAPTDISLSTSFTVSQVEWFLWVQLHETRSNTSLTYNYLMTIAVHSPYSSAVPTMQNILSTSVGLQTWIKLKTTYFWPDTQPESNFFCWDLMLPNGDFHIYSFFFLSVFITLAFLHLPGSCKVFKVILNLTINFSSLNSIKTDNTLNGIQNLPSWLPTQQLHKSVLC